MPHQVSMMGWVGLGEDFCALGWVGLGPEIFASVGFWKSDQWPTLTQRVTNKKHTNTIIFAPTAGAHYTMFQCC